MSKLSPVNDFVQNHPPVSPRFFIGSSPSQATQIISPDYPAAGVMVSFNALRDRASSAC